MSDSPLPMTAFEQFRESYSTLERQYQQLRETYNHQLQVNSRLNELVSVSNELEQQLRNNARATASVLLRIHEVLDSEGGHTHVASAALSVLRQLALSQVSLQVVQLQLCEQAHTTLRPDVYYVFKADPSCEACRRLSQ